MRILTLSGSVNSSSSNARLLDALPAHFPIHQFKRFDLAPIPLFHPNHDSNPLPVAVKDWRAALAAAELVIISTPAYIHNIPAVLKNALEWIASSGEFVSKPTLAITYTPKLPRGEKAMQSLLWSLQALDAQIKLSLPLDQVLLSLSEAGTLVGEEGIEMLELAIAECIA